MRTHEDNEPAEADRLIDEADAIKLKILRAGGDYEIRYKLSGSIVGGANARAAIVDLFYRLESADSAQGGGNPGA